MLLNFVTRWLTFVVILTSLVIIDLSIHFSAKASSANDTILQILQSALNEEGSPYELNRGPDGSMWVSDNLTGEIRRYAGEGSLVEVFSDLGTVSDAREGADGGIWFVDQATRQLGRLDPLAETVSYWALPGNAPSGTAIDEQGRVWVSVFSQASLHRFDPSSSELCTFDTSALAGSGSLYLAVEGGSLWLSAFSHNSVLRLDLESNLLTRWYYYSSITWDFEAQGLAGDGAGGLWFTDSNHKSLVHLELDDPDQPRLLRYLLPTGYSAPAMLTRLESGLWYSSRTPPALGWLIPEQVTPQEYIPEVDSATLTPSCSTVEASPPEPVTVTSQAPEWSEASYVLSSPAAGWSMLALESESFPWGVAVQEGELWAVDNGLSRLLRLQSSIELTACKLGDADGDLATTTDRIPVPGWTLYLTLEGAPQAGVITGQDGCYTWEDLQPGQTVSVEEEERVGWVALTTTSHDFGTLELGRIYAHTFVNAQTASLTACKLGDADGDLATTTDRMPIPGWTLYLTLEGAQQAGVITGQDGCFTWEDLQPGQTASVEEEERAGWVALTPTSHDFGALAAGGSYVHTFVNAEVGSSENSIYLPVLLR